MSRHTCRFCRAKNADDILAILDERRQQTNWTEFRSSERRSGEQLCACGDRVWRHKKHRGACLERFCPCAVVRYPKRRLDQDAARRTA